MNRRIGSSLAIPFALLLTGCPDGGGGGGGGFEGVPFAVQSYLKAGNTGASDNFGRRVALDGDTLVVGAPDEDSAGVGVNSGLEADNSASGSGAVYVFVRNNGVWSLQAYIKASNTETGDAFGSSVAISGDTLVVGAPNEDSSLTTIIQSPSSANEPATGNGALESGSVYVFTRSGTTWSQQAYVKASNAGPADNFGSSLSINGNTIVVGAVGEDSDVTGVISGSPNEAATGDAAPGSGAVYVFTRSGSTWTQQAYVKASNTEAGDAFGTGVGIDGDTLVAGATGEDSNAIGVNPGLVAESDNTANASGAVYVFTRSGSTWTQQAYVKASNTEAGDAFGTSLSISDTRLVVGAPGEDSNLTTVLQGSPNDLTTGDGAAGAGAVYAFIDQGGGWTQQVYVKASNADAGDAFGVGVAMNGDTLAVGATGEKSSATGVGGNQADNSLLNAGAVYTFR